MLFLEIIMAAFIVIVFSVLNNRLIELWFKVFKNEAIASIFSAVTCILDGCLMIVVMTAIRLFAW